MGYFDNEYFIGFFSALLASSGMKKINALLQSYFAKRRFFLVTVGDEMNESYWQRGNAILTLYTDKEGYRVFDNSKLSIEILSKLSEQDRDELISFLPKKKYTEKDLFQFISAIRRNNSCFFTLSDFLKEIKQFSKEHITIYRIHLDSSKVFLEEIQSN